ncbi:hypothetical protein GCM10010429_32130 [Micromonospora olivasterospora]
MDGPPARALRTSARAVIDLEPGSRSEAITGSDAVGAVHGRSGRVAVRFPTVTFCRVREPGGGPRDPLPVGGTAEDGPGR